MLRSGDETAGFELATPPVPEHLKRFVSSWTGYREWSAAPVRRVEFPMGRAVLIFEFGPALGVGRADASLVHHGGFFAGIDDAPSVTVFQRAQAGVQVNLTVAGALAFAGAPLAREVASLNDLGLHRSLAEQLAHSTWSERFRLVTRTLEAKFAVAREPSRLLTWATERIDTAHGALRIDELSDELGFSRKHLHAKFIDELGLSPKRYADVRRFARALERLRTKAFRDLASLALELGYSDQSHLTREVKRFTGNSPTALTLEDPLSLAVNAAPG
ncbi:MAG: helix-turn-helix transcriptional regulator [Archangium sp.]|nr:helix-turn-helix transcriptional regulator [Archangium sp.]